MNVKNNNIDPIQRFIKHKARLAALNMGLIIGGVTACITSFVIFIAIIYSVILGVKGTCAPDNSNPLSGDVSGGGGSWTQKGTKDYNTAKTIWDRLTKDLGLSGAATAGVMGTIDQESKFHTDAVNAGDNGSGLIQWTFARTTALKSFAESKGKSWTDLDVQIEMLENDMKNQAMWTSGKFKDNSLKTFGTTTDPKEAAERFYISQMVAGGGYTSDPDGSGSKRIKAAETAYKLFNGSSVKADESKLDSLSSGKNNSSSNSSGGSDDSADANCVVESSGKWGWPFKSIKGKPQISGAQLFGNVGGGRKNGFHDGVDFGTVPYNRQDILAIHDGTVYKIDHQGSTQNDLGWYVCVKSDDGYYEVYQEFAFDPGDKDKAISVKVGDRVTTGQKIGTLDSSLSNVTHVHIGVSKKEIMAAQAHAFSNDGTWIDWSKLVEEDK